MKLLLKAKKSLGQNFLIDKNIIKKIIEIGNINKNKIIMEIGSGYGDLTKNIVNNIVKNFANIKDGKKFFAFPYLMATPLAPTKKAVIKPNISP